MVNDYVFMKDREQCEPDAKRCPVDDTHGRLSVHGSGNGLVCLNRTSASGEKLSLCEYAEPFVR